MLKVANVIEEGRYGGPQSRIAAVAEKLKKNGIETVVVFPEKDSDVFYKKLTEKGIQTRRLSQHRLTKQKAHLIKYFVFFVPEAFALYRFFKKERVNIVHCNGAWQVKGVIAGRLVGARVIWHLNDTQMPPFIKNIFRFLASYFCDAFIAAGKMVQAYYLSDQKFSEKQIRVIQAPVDTSLFDPQKNKEGPRIEKYSGIKIVTVGNLSRIKGIEYFIEMAATLSRQYSDLNFFVIGSHFDNQKKYSEKMFAMVKKFKLKNVHFYGPSDDIPSVLKAADIYVCSSIAEASPISVWEAMSMAKAIVSTNVGDVSEFIGNGENGFVVPVKDAIALAEKVAILIKNIELRRKFGQQARETAIKHLDIEFCAKKHAQLYREIMDK